MLWRLHPVVSEINTVVFMATGRHSVLWAQDCPSSITWVLLGGSGFLGSPFQGSFLPKQLWPCMVQCNSGAHPLP